MDCELPQIDSTNTIDRPSGVPQPREGCFAKLGHVKTDRVAET
jgi:hypothetical protein